MHIQFIGNCMQNCSYTGNATGNYSNGMVKGSYIHEGEQYEFDSAITPSNKLLITLYKDN
jgi:hypothetical protein